MPFQLFGNPFVDIYVVASLAVYLLTLGVAMRLNRVAYFHAPGIVHACVAIGGMMTMTIFAMDEATAMLGLYALTIGVTFDTLHVVTYWVMEKRFARNSIDRISAGADRPLAALRIGATAEPQPQRSVAEYEATLRSSLIPRAVTVDQDADPETQAAQRAAQRQQRLRRIGLIGGAIAGMNLYFAYALRELAPLNFAIPAVIAVAYALIARFAIDAEKTFMRTEMTRSELFLCCVFAAANAVIAVVALVTSLQG